DRSPRRAGFTQPALVAQAARHQQLAELTRLDDLDHLRHFVAAAALRAVLHNAAVTLGGLDGDAAFMDIVAAGLFDVDVLPSLAAPDGHEGMPMVGRGDGNG